MGTNYYWINPGKPACECCKRPYPEERIHIGKSSAGWMFALHETEEIHSLVEWMAKLQTPGSHIEDEYGDRISYHQMLFKITNRDPDSERHPFENGRVRPGMGTYDLIKGEFF